MPTGRTEIDVLITFGHRGHRRSDMECNPALIIDLRCHIQCHTGKERLGGDGRRIVRSLARTTAGRGRRRRRHRRDEIVITAHLDHRLLVIQSCDTRAGQHIKRALRLQEVDQRSKAARLKRQPECAGNRKGFQDAGGTS